MTVREVHDLLLEHKPEDAQHDRTTCVFCKEVAVASNEGGKKIVADDKLYDQAQLDALIKSAVEKALADAQGEADTQIAMLSAKRDELEAVVADLRTENTELQEAIAQRDEQARLVALAEERVSQISEIVALPDARVEASRMRWAKMSEEEFAALLEDFRSVKTDKPNEHETLTQTRAVASKTSDSPAISYIKTVGG